MSKGKKYPIPNITLKNEDAFVKWCGRKTVQKIIKTHLQGIFNHYIKLEVEEELDNAVAMSESTFTMDM